jgi:hypothetical protein
MGSSGRVDNPGTLKDLLWTLVFFTLVFVVMMAVIGAYE